MVLAYDDSVSAIEIGVPVPGGRDFPEPVELSDVFETLVDELPGALPVRPDLTAILSGAAAGTVEQPFGAACNRTNPAVLA